MLAASTLLVALRIHLATSSADSNPCTLLLCTSTSASLITTDALACPSLFFSILLFYSFFWVSSTSACVRCTASHEASAFFPQCLPFFNLPEAVASNDGDGRLLDQPPAFTARHEPTHQDCHDPVNHKATDTDTRQPLIPLGEPSPCRGSRPRGSWTRAAPKSDSTHVASATSGTRTPPLPPPLEHPPLAKALSLAR